MRLIDFAILTVACVAFLVFLFDHRLLIQLMEAIERWTFGVGSSPIACAEAAPEISELQKDSCLTQVGGD